MMEPIDYIRLQDSFGGKFVAIREDKVVASADTHGELVRVLKDNNLEAEDVVFEFIRPKGRVCAY